jgi:drug/metabolite transporter (DMT)-like permease
MDSHSSLRGALLAVAASAGFATLAVFGRWALDAGMTANTLLQWRFGIAAAVMAALGQLRHPLPGKLRALLFGSGLVYTTQTSFYFLGLERISAGTTALLLYLAPLFVVIYGRMFFGRRASKGQLLAVALGLMGLGIIVGLPSAADSDPIGIAFGAAAGAVLAWYVMAGELLFARVPPLVTAAHTMAGAAVGFVAVDLVDGSLSLPETSEHWLLIAAVVVIPTLVSIPMLFAAIAELGAGPTAVISNAEPVFTALLGALFLAEAIGPTQAAGAALILGAATVAQRTARRAAAPSAVAGDTHGRGATP